MIDPMETDSSKALTPALVRMEFTPSAVLIPVVRRFISEFYDRLVIDKDTVSRVALATHELLENTVKYSIDGVASIAIDVKERDTGGFATVRFRNRASAENIE